MIYAMLAGEKGLMNMVVGADFVPGSGLYSVARKANGVI
jgi:hypothetical protein